MALTVVSPDAIPVTVPVSVTAAILLFADDHVTVLSSAVIGSTLKLISADCPLNRLSVSGVTVTSDTSKGSAASVSLTFNATAVSFPA